MLRARHVLGVVIALTLLAACASSDDREWMKPGQTYTRADFKRDVEACTRDGKLDDACMRGRGWIAVSPAATDKPPAERMPRY